MSDDTNTGEFTINPNSVDPAAESSDQTIKLEPDPLAGQQQRFFDARNKAKAERFEREQLELREKGQPEGKP